MALTEMPPSNSNNSKRLKHVTPVAQARLEEKRGGRLRNALVAETGRALFEYVIYDVVVPMIKDAAAATFNRALYGDGRGYPVGRNTNYGRTDYGAYSRPRSDGSVRDPRRELSPRVKSQHNFDEVVFNDRAEADLVLERLMDLIDTYGVATVADFYDLAGISTDYPDNSWGWERLGGAAIRRTRAGYILDLPRPVTIDQRR
jgi:hypothetical protein|nr:MAG TPA: hypothetical protein [Caudoviricetes sp.]